MQESRLFVGTGESGNPAPRRQYRGGKNGLSGTLSNLASNEVPLRKKIEFNINNDLDFFYSQLVNFVDSSSELPDLVFDIHSLFHALGMKGNNPVVIYSRMVHDILSREIARWNRTLEIGGKIEDTIEPQTYTDSELKKLTSGYASLKGSIIIINKRGAEFLIHYIDQVASDQGYHWSDNGWEKYFNGKLSHGRK